jgi:ATP-binding cassette subfamily B multidrug efflux pump
MSGAPEDMFTTTDSGLLRRMVVLVKPYPWMFAWSLILYLPLNLGGLVQPYLMGRMVDAVQGPSVEAARAADTLMMLGMAYLGAMLLQAVGMFAQQSLTQVLGQRVTRDLRSRLFAKVQRLDAAYFDRTPAGRTMTRLTNDVESLAEVFASGSATILGDVLFLLGTLVLLVWVSPPLTLGGMALLPLLAVALHFFRKAARDAFREVRTHTSAINGFLQEHISGMSVVQLFGAEARTARRFEEMNAGFKGANVRAITLDATIYAVVDAVSMMSVALLLVVASAEVAGNAVTLGVAVAFVEYLQRFFMPLRDMATKYTLVQSALAAGERIFQLMDEPERVEPAASPVSIDSLGQGIRFEDVSFQYAAGTRAADHVSFTVKPGEKVALVGRTGSGKSTLTRLLLRHYDVTGGAILINGKDIRGLDTTSLRKTIASVPQEVHLFSGTIAENLRFGAPQATDEQLWDALRAVQADGMVKAREGGLNAVCQERGGNLSVGERQLLAFARALLADPACIILDEATASVDPETERRLQLATQKLLEGRTALMVAHRLSTIESADRILVMQAGRVTEEGTHTELLAKGGYYARLHALQNAAA